MAGGSLYVHADRGIRVEANLYRAPWGFPMGTCLATDRGYAPLDYVGAPYDSGLRVDTPDGRRLQVCSSTVRNLLATRLAADNMLVRLNDLEEAFTELVHVLGHGRVQMGNGEVVLTAPPAGGHVSRLLFIGTGVRLALDNGLGLSTDVHGWSASSFGGDAQRLGRALLLSLVPGTRVRLSLVPDAALPLTAALAAQLNRLTAAFAAVAGTAPPAPLVPAGADVPALMDRVGVLERLAGDVAGQPVDTHGRTRGAWTDCMARLVRLSGLFERLADESSADAVRWRALSELVGEQPVRACALLGGAVEDLPLAVGSRAPVVSAQGWCVYDHAARDVVHAADAGWSRALVRVVRQRMIHYRGASVYSWLSTEPMRTVDAEQGGER